MPDPFIETSRFTWAKQTYKVKEDAVYRVAGPDAAMFMRNLKSTAVMFFGFAVLAIGVLIANDEDRGGLMQSLEKLTMSNISNKDSRMWAHVVLFCVLVCKYDSAIEEMSVYQLNSADGLPS
ncbi:hypothetical protein EC988_000854 [Linderina pennispora]|nr:hypothetical protein EC988_000854 [Linderina pennispora]